MATRNEILSAIVAGVKIQDKTNTGWTDVTDEFALRILSAGGGGYLRVKPEMTKFSGFEYTAPTNNKDDIYFVKISANGKSYAVTFDRSDNADELYTKIAFQLKP